MSRGFATTPEQLKYDMRDTSITPDKFCMRCFREYDELPPYRIKKIKPGGIATIEPMRTILPPESEDVCFNCASKHANPIYNDNTPLEEIFVRKEDMQRFIWRSLKIKELIQLGCSDPWHVSPSLLDGEIQRLKSNLQKKVW